MTKSFFSRQRMILFLLPVAAIQFSCGTPTASETREVSRDSATNAQSGKLTLKPVNPAPQWAPDITPEMAVVIEKLVSLGGKPIETLDAKEARMQPTPTDAVMAVMADHNMKPSPRLCDTVNRSIPLKSGSTMVRIYTPTQGLGPYPVIVYYHGGGWVIADINVYNAGAQALCEQTGAVVVSVEYPKGPENKFPAAHNTAFEAYQWVLNNTESLKADSTRVAVAGESAGGNLAANVSIMARDKKIKMPLYQVLVYPVANNDTASDSYTRYANAKPLNKTMMGWFVKNALGSFKVAADPRISLVKANLAGLPPTLIIAAEIDPLLSEGRLLSDKLKEAGVTTEYSAYNGVTHEFFGMASVIPQAKDAQALAASKLKAAFNTK